jgi:hypothetical protein
MSGSSTSPGATSGGDSGNELRCVAESGDKGDATKRRFVDVIVRPLVESNDGRAAERPALDNRRLIYGEGDGDKARLPSTPPWTASSILKSLTLGI